MAPTIAHVKASIKKLLLLNNALNTHAETEKTKGNIINITQGGKGFHPIFNNLQTILTITLTMTSKKK
jgi:hypothetical protein